MGNGMNKILPGLYIGGICDAQDPRQVKSITHVLSIHDARQHPIQDKIHLRLHLADDDNENISQYFTQSNTFIHSARMSGGKVLVHCLAGMSRSVTLVIAYIMTVTDLCWYDALCAVRVARSCANPNLGFQRQLVIYQRTMRDAERERLNQIKPVDPGQNFDDSRHVKKLLKSYHRCITFK